MRLKDMTVDDFKNIIAVVAIAIGLFVAIAVEQKDLSYVLAGALGGIVTTTKQHTVHMKGDKDDN